MAGPTVTVRDTSPSPQGTSGVSVHHLSLTSLGCLFFFFFDCSMTYDILAQPGIEPKPPALETQSLNHWTTKEVPGLVPQSCPTLCDPVTVDHQASLSMDFSRQEYWSGLLFPSPGDLPNPGFEPTSPTSAGGFFTI